MPTLLATRAELAEALAPDEQNLGRATALDLPDVAQAILLGIVTALQRCRDAPDGTVLAYAGPDTPLEHAAWLIRQARAAGIDLDPEKVDARCPDRLDAAARRPPADLTATRPWRPQRCASR